MFFSLFLSPPDPTPQPTPHPKTVVLASPSYAASLLRNDDDAEGVYRDLEQSSHLLGRKVRSLPYGGGSIDMMNGFDPFGPIDAFLQPLVVEEDDSSEEEMEEIIAELEEQIAELKSNPKLDPGAVEERVAEIQEQIAAKIPPPPEPPAKPSVNPQEAAAEAQEQQPQQVGEQTGG